MRRAGFMGLICRGCGGRALEIGGRLLSQRLRGVGFSDRRSSWRV